MKSILFFLMKITGFPLDLLVFKRKVYYENRFQQKRALGKGCLIVSNHRGWIDYIVLMFVFFFRKVRPVVSYEIYHKNKVLTFFLDVIGAIPLGKVSWDPSYVEVTVEQLRKGKAVMIFPEGHFLKKDELLPFGNIYLRIAAEACVPIVPFYTDGVYSFFHRNRVMIGEPYYVTNFAQIEGDKEKVEALNDQVKGRILALQEETRRRKGNPLFSFHNILMDVGRFFLFTHFGFIYRTHVIDLMKSYRYHKLNGPFVMVSNHLSFADPLVLLCGFWRRRIHILIAKEVYDNKRIRFFGLNHLGGIKIDRSSLDIEAIDNSIQTLRRGRALLVFAQGKIERSGELTPFKEGPAMIASRANVPIVPVYIYPRRYYQSHYVYVGEPIYPMENGRKALRETSEKVENAIADLEEYAMEERKHGKK